jgi:hypothetical protein
VNAQKHVRPKAQICAVSKGAPFQIRMVTKNATCFSFADNLDAKNLSLREGVWGVDGCDVRVGYW